MTVFFDNQSGSDSLFLDFVDACARLRHLDTGLAPIASEPAVALDQAVLVIKQDKPIGDAFDGITEALAGGFGFFPGPIQGLVAALQFLHGLVQRLGAFPHLLGKHNRVLEGRIGLRLVG